MTTQRQHTTKKINRERPTMGGSALRRGLVRSCLLLAGWVWAPLGAQGQAEQQERVALVVGNSEYQCIGELANRGNDATAIAEALKWLDFNVTMLLDASRSEYSAALKRLAVQSQKAVMALVLYAGHGLQTDRSGRSCGVRSRCRRVVWRVRWGAS